MKNPDKSPLKDRPLRIPGQSLDDEMQKILEGELSSSLLFPILLIVFSFCDWLLWYQVVKLPNPVLISIIAIGVSVYSFFRLIKIT